MHFAKYLTKVGANMIKEIGSTSLGSKYTSVKMWKIDVGPAVRDLKEHRHLNFEIGLVLGGKGVYHTPNGSKNIEKGNIFVFTSNEPHYITKIDPEGLSILYLHFSNSATERNPLLNEKYPFIFYNHSPSFDNKIESDPEISNKLQSIEDELMHRQEGYQCAISALISDIFILLIRKHGYYPQDINASQPTERLRKAIEYINHHYCESLTLAQIAEQCNITPNYFSALFKDCLNTKLWDYITAKRIEKAKRMLDKADRSLNILDIAIQCGYSNTANFNRAFKQHTGITPSQYRNSNYIDLV